MISKKNIKNHELIGLNVKVKKTKGKIVNETKNTIIINDGVKEKIIPKKGNDIQIKIGEQKIIIKEDEIIQKPYDRLKKKYKVKNKWQQKVE